MGHVQGVGGEAGGETHVRVGQGIREGLAAGDNNSDFLLFCYTTVVSTTYYLIIEVFLGPEVVWLPQDQVVAQSVVDDLVDVLGWEYQADVIEAKIDQYVVVATAKVWKKVVKPGPVPYIRDSPLFVYLTLP